MNIRQLLVKQDPTIGTLLTNFPPKDAVLDDYFYISNSLANDQGLYADSQISLILNLTDFEYAELVDKYLKASSGEVVEDNTSEELLQAQSKIRDIEQKIEKSKKYEEEAHRRAEYEAELQTLKQDLALIEDIESKYTATYADYSKFYRFKSYDLNKIHEDLVLINKGIKDAEDELLHLKSKEIVQARDTAPQTMTINHGKLVLAFGLGFGIACLALVLYLLEMPQSVIILTAIVGVILCAMIVWTGKEPASESEQYYSQDDVVDTNSVRSKLDILRREKMKILSLMGLKTSDEFFNAKAQIGSLVKSLKYISEQKNKVMESIDYGRLIHRKTFLEENLLILQSSQLKEDDKLSSEQYLALYRELDTLKLKVSNLSKNSGLSKEALASKLLSIRNELKDKLPGFARLIGTTFKNNFETVKAQVDEFTTALGLPLSNVSDELYALDHLRPFEKFLIQYALGLSLYPAGFACAVEFTSTWPEGDQKDFDAFVQNQADRQQVIFKLDY